MLNSNLNNHNHNSVNYSNVSARLGENGNVNFPMTFIYTGQEGQPNWIWGTNNGTDHYVWKPENMRVNHSNTTDGVVSIGENIIQGDGNDTISNWKNFNTSISFFSPGVLPDQPGDYGVLFSMVYRNEIHQLWGTQPDGALYHRSGNNNGWRTDWKEILDSNNYENLIQPALNNYIRSVSNGNYQHISSLYTLSDSNNCLITGDKGTYIFDISEFSDSRVKANVKDSKIEALKKINDIELYEFDYIDEKFGTHQDIGYVAQQLIDVIPECVVSVPQNKEQIGYDELYQVQDIHLIPYLVKAVQELSQKLEDSNKIINELTKKVEELKNI